jgi:hypothetical protein
LKKAAGWEAIKPSEIFIELAEEKALKKAFLDAVREILL